MPDELHRIVHLALKSNSSSVAVSAHDERHTYQDLYSAAARLVASFKSQKHDVKRVGILASQSFAAYVCVIACLLSGRSFVPLNGKFPCGRLQSILKVAQVDTVVYDSVLLDHPLLRTLESSIAIVDIRSLCPSETTDINLEAHGQPAYIMFTSGSTGEPKGIAVSRRSLHTYLVDMGVVVGLTEKDICTQNFELSFDLSVHDILLTFLAGASLAVPGPNDMIDLVGFAARSDVTCWFSVPAVIGMARRLRRLQTGSLPNVRLSLFCGEALTASDARAWMDAAQNSRFLNLYGPTEATIAITWYDFGDPAEWRSESTVPIGRPLPSSRTQLVKRRDGASELILGGPQIAGGYINNATEEAARFVRLPDDLPTAVWYKTGDIVKETANGLVFIGRDDGQVKVQGYRVELGEIESSISSLIPDAQVAAIVRPNKVGINQVECYIVADKLDTELLRNALSHRLPSYMMPAAFHLRSELPFNSSGKVDRSALKRFE